MRGAIALVVLGLLLAAGLVAPAPLERWDHPAGARPQLMPPLPGVQRWPGPMSPGAWLPTPSPAQTVGTAKVLVLLVDFQDEGPDPAHTAAYFDDLFNGPSAGSMRAYYDEVSFGTLTIQATVVSTWFHSSQFMVEYGEDGAMPPDDANGPIYRLVTETVQLADASGWDFAPFDANSDGVVDHVIVVHAGAGQENTQDPNNRLIWSHQWEVLDANPSFPDSQPLIADGVQIDEYTMVSESSPIGVVAHEFGHDLGLPDLYDPDGSSEGIGIWDLMSGGSWNGIPAGSSPAHFSAWCLIELGWVSPVVVTDSLVGTQIPAVATTGRILRLDVPGTSGREYFLVENRQPIGFDAALPGSGLLIWHVDETQVSNGGDARRLVDLEEADEAVSGDRPTDSSDPWRDSASGWGPDTTPGSRAYGGADTGWRVREISASGATMTATIARDVQEDLGVSGIRIPFMSSVGTPIDIQVDARNDGAQSGDVELQATVYRETVSPAARVAGQTFTRGGLAAGTTATFTLTFTPMSAGRYLVHTVLVGADDEVPANDERVAHVLVNAFTFRDDFEPGLGGWTTNDDDPFPYAHRWRIVNDSEADGASHSRTHAWRFGYVPTLPPNPFPPDWHTLTSPAIGVGPGPTFLILYTRHDLSGRTFPLFGPGENETDDAYIEVSYDGGASWVQMAHLTGRDLSWRGVSFNLTSNVTAATTIRVRFNVSANVMGDTGGWWIDDVMIAERGLSRAVLLLGSEGPHEGPAGGNARFLMKVANVGDMEGEFRLDAVLPDGWDVRIDGASPSPLRGHVVRLAPDNDLALRVVLAIPAGVPSGTQPVTLSVTAVGDSDVTASLTVQARVSGIPIEWILSGVFLVVAAVLIVIVATVARRRRRRPPA